jgi:hypothetical protein
MNYPIEAGVAPASPTSADTAPSPKPGEHQQPGAHAAVVESEADTDFWADAPEVEEAEPSDKGPEDAAERQAWDPPADPEALASWREERNIPADAKGYEPVELKIDDAVVKIDSTDPIFASLTQRAHDLNLRQDDLGSLAEWAVQERAAHLQRRRESDKAESAERITAVPAQTRNLAQRTLRSLPGDLRRAISNARLGDGLGTKLVNTPGFAEMLAELGQARIASGQELHSPLQDAKRAQEIKTVMRTDIDRYYAQRLDRELTEILDRQTAREGASK